MNSDLYIRKNLSILSGPGSTIVFVKEGVVAYAGRSVRSTESSSRWKAFRTSWIRSFQIDRSVRRKAVAFSWVLLVRVRLLQVSRPLRVPCPLRVSCSLQIPYLSWVSCPLWRDLRVEVVSSTPSHKLLSSLYVLGSTFRRSIPWMLHGGVFRQMKSFR